MGNTPQKCKNPPAFAWRVSLGGLLRKSVIVDYGGRFRTSQRSRNEAAVL